MNVHEAEFDKLSPRSKGYAVYTYGDDPDVPNIPKKYTPLLDEEDEYNIGQQIAVMAAQDNP